MDTAAQPGDARPHDQHVEVLGNLLPGGRFPYAARSHRLTLRDGDQLVVHDDLPSEWQPSDPVAVLVHGLGGDHRSGYMVRIAAKLNQQGVRGFSNGSAGLWGS